MPGRFIREAGKDKHPSRPRHGGSEPAFARCQPPLGFASGFDPTTGTRHMTFSLFPQPSAPPWWHWPPNTTAQAQGTPPTVCRVARTANNAASVTAAGGGALRAPGSLEPATPWLQLGHADGIISAFTSQLLQPPPKHARPGWPYVSSTATEVFRFWRPLSITTTAPKAASTPGPWTNHRVCGQRKKRAQVRRTTAVRHQQEEPLGAKRARRRREHCHRLACHRVLPGARTFETGPRAQL